MMSKSLAIGMAFMAVLAVASFSARAGDDDEPGRARKGAFGSERLPWIKGSKPARAKASQSRANLRSDDGALQLSVYTMKGDQFAEVLVDHKSGSIKKSEPITDPDDLKDAKEQGEAMAKAKLPLAAAVASAVKANNGFRAVSAVPMLDGGQPVASITLMKGEEVKKVTEKLD